MFEKLKEKLVFRVGIAYLICSWLILQVASIVFPIMSVPIHYQKLLLIILSLGFIVTLIVLLLSETIKNGTPNDRQRAKTKTNAVNRIIIASLSLLIIVLVFDRFSNNLAQNQPTTSIQSEDQIKVKKLVSIAVLPLENLSPDPSNEVYSKSVSGEVINKLLKIDDLNKVVSHQTMKSYEDTKLTVSELAKALDVTHIISGSFQIIEDQLKVQFDLIDASSDKTTELLSYSGKWDVKKIFAIQSELALNLAVKLNIDLTEDESKSIESLSTNNVEAYEHYIKAEYGKFNSDKENYKESIAHYTKAIELDPEFAEAYAGLGYLWKNSGLILGIVDEKTAWSKAEKFLVKAFELDPKINGLEKGIVSGQFYFDWNFDRIENYYQSTLTSIKLSETPDIDADYPIKTGRAREALYNINRTIELRPNVPEGYSFRVEALYHINEKEAALKLLDSVRNRFDHSPNFLRESIKYYFYLGQTNKAEKQLQKFYHNYSDRPPILRWLAIELAITTKNEMEVKSNLDFLLKGYKEGSSGSPAWFLCLYYCGRKDYESALSWLEKSFERHEVEMTWLQEEPILEPLMSNKRYLKIYNSMDFNKVNQNK